MNIFDDQNNEVYDKNYYDWAGLLKTIGLCSVLSIFVSVLCMPKASYENIFRMAGFVIVFSIGIMFIPVLIGLGSLLLNRDYRFLILIIWTIIAGLMLLGSFAR